jgi:hypothetical protein
MTNLILLPVPVTIPPLSCFLPSLNSLSISTSTSAVRRSCPTLFWSLIDDLAKRSAGNTEDESGKIQCWTKTLELLAGSRRAWFWYW